MRSAVGFGRTGAPEQEFERELERELGRGLSKLEADLEQTEAN